MLKALKQILFGALFGTLIATQALGQATLLPNAKQQFFTPQGIPAASGTVDMYVPSTNTRKTTWKTSTESVGNQNTNPVLLDAGGFATIYGDGQYRQVVKDADGNTIWDAVTASTGGGSGPSPGPTVGDGNIVGTILPWAGLVAPPNYVFTYGQAISRTTYPLFTSTVTIVTNLICTSGLNVLSGIGDTSQIPIGAPVEASCIAPGTTVTAVASTSVTVSNNASISTAISATFFPYGNGDGSTTLNVPDFRGRHLTGRNNMGGTASATLTSTYFGTSPNALGAAAGGQNQVLLTGNLPPYTPSGSVSVTSTATNVVQGTPATTGLQSGANSSNIFNNGTPPIATAITSTGTLSGTAQGGTSALFSIISPTSTINYVIKVLPDASTTVATGVALLGGMTGVIACGTNVTCGSQTISVVVPSSYPASAIIYSPPATGGVPVTQQIYDQRYVLAADYGAVCDGTTDDTNALQRGYNSIAGTGTWLIVPVATCIISNSFAMNVANSNVRGAGPGSIIKSTSLTADGVIISAGNQTISDITISSTVASRTGSGIHTTTASTGVHILRTQSTGHKYGYWITSPAVDFGYNVAASNLNFGVFYDNTTGGLNINESQIVEVQSNANTSGGGFGFSCNTSNNATGIFMVRPTAASNTGAGILFTGGATQALSCNDIFITQPEFATNTGSGIDTTANANGTTLNVSGGFVEAQGGACGICSYMILTNVTATTFSGNTTGLFLNAAGSSVSGTVFNGQSVSALTLGASSSLVSLTGIQTSTAGTTNLVGLTIAGGAAAFSCSGSDFSQATTAVSGSVPASTRTAACSGLSDKLGTPASVILTNATGTASGLTAGTVTTNANLTGDVTSAGNTTTLATAQPGAHTWALNQNFSVSINITPTVVASLPTCNSGADGLRAFVTNNNTATAFGGAVTTGGTNHHPVYCDGSAAAWKQG